MATFSQVYIEEFTDYAKIDYRYQRHHERYRKYVESMSRKLWCQACRGAGGETVSVLDYGGGPWEMCGWCEGTGLLTPWLRGWYLRIMKEEKRERRQK